MRTFHVYILASISRVLYTGVTSNLGVRLWEHRSKRYPNAFTSQYNVTKLVYLEEYTIAHEAIARETQIKAWRRSKKLRLIEGVNPEWRDLAPENAPMIPVSRMI